MRTVSKRSPGGWAFDWALFRKFPVFAGLVLTVLMVAAETKGNNLIAPFAIGMAAVAGIFAG